MAKDVGIAALVLAGWQWVEVFGWVGILAAAIAVALYVRLRMSDPVARAERLGAEVKRVLAALAEEKARVIDLTNRNDELRTINNRLQAELNEMKAGMRELRAAFDRNGETIARLADDLKYERELRDTQYRQWIKEKADRGDL